MTRSSQVTLLGGFRLIAAVTFAIFASALCSAQEQQAPEVHIGDYSVHQTIELGVRVSEFAGNQGASDTFVDLHSGPRLLEQSMELDSLDQHGLLLTTFRCGR